jgi:hypothetical protein
MLNLQQKSSHEVLVCFTIILCSRTTHTTCTKFLLISHEVLFIQKRDDYLVNLGHSEFSLLLQYLPQFAEENFSLERI